MYRALLTALALSVSVPALAQQDTAAQPAATDAAAPALSPEQVTAFNQAVKDFSAAQQAQQANDLATASTKYAAALPAIRAVVTAQPDNIENVSFLANTLYAKAAADFGQQKLDDGVAAMEESLPHWRKVVEAKPAEAANKALLTSLLIQVGNSKLTKQDKAGADVLYTEALTSAKALPADNASKNLQLAALIGASQTSENAAIKTEAATLSKAMLADGSVDAANKQAAEILAGAAQ